MIKIMFDTNVFDQLQNYMEMIKKSTNKYQYFITTIQIDELCEIPDIATRKNNFLMLADLRATLVPLSVCILNGIAHLNYVRLGNGEVYEQILSPSHNNINDAAIADTAVYENCTLVTDDKDFYKKMKRQGYASMKFNDFLQSLM